MNTFSIGCIVVNYFKEDLTEQCVRSLSASAGNFVIDTIVVDNGSKRKLDFSCSHSPYFKVETLTSRQNLGFADGCNLAAEILLARRVQYLLLLNNDAEVEPNTLARLLIGIEVSTDVCAVTGKIQFGGSRRRDFWYAGARFSKLTGRPYHCSSGDESFDRIDKDGLVSAVPFISGCCMLMRANLVGSHGLFRGGLFAYGEDLDWCLRMTSLGYRLGYIDTAIVIHHPSSSFRSVAGKTLPLAHFLSARNLLFVNRLHLRGLLLGRAVFLNVAKSLALALAFLMAGRIRKGVVTAQAVYLGLFSPIPPIGDSQLVNYGIPWQFDSR